ncbi:MAG TPA: C39 family peptidase [Blastocatellia bacterium]|nr:C39 family peptidase [Blastocatellia bacterium]
MAKHNFPRIIQEQSNWCGPACVEMMLKYLGVEISTTGFSSLQDKISSFEHKTVDNTMKYMAVNETDKDEWQDFATSPVEIVNMFQGLAKELDTPQQGSQLVAHLGANPLSELSMNYFSIDARKYKDDPNSEIRKEKIWEFLGHLADVINQDSKPPIIIPLHGFSHWVVLYDVKVTANQPGNRRWTFTGKDPEQYPPKTKSKNPKAGIITVTDSSDNFDNPVNLVCIEPLPNGNVANSRQGWNLGAPPALPTRPPGTPISPEEILNLVRKELSATGDNVLNMIGRRAAMFSLATPVLVRRLDRPNYDYYLVAVKDNNGEVVQLFRMDALTGAYLDSLQIDPAVLYFDIQANDPATQSMLRSIKLQLHNSSNARQSLSALQASNAPNLIWQPSAQSQSPFYPFHKVAEGDKSAFIRIDGTHFQQINPASTPVIAQESSHM